VKFLLGRHAFMIAMPLAAAALLAAGGARVTAAALAQAPAVAAASQTAAASKAQDEKGERILNVSCGGCHDLRPVQASAKDKDGWNEVVQNMLQKGADVADADLPVLLDYLVEHHGPMPDGKGKDVVLNVCTMCHDLSRIKRGQRSPEEWGETLNSMLNEGAPLSDADYPVVLQYLSKNFAH
jgi:cytochrome c5